MVKKKDRPTFVVCLRADQAAPLSGNAKGRCVECGCEVQFHPDAPDYPKICLDCAPSDVIEEFASNVAKILGRKPH